LIFSQPYPLFAPTGWPATSATRITAAFNTVETDLAVPIAATLAHPVIDDMRHMVSMQPNGLLTAS